MTIETTIAFSCFNAEDTIKRSLMSVLSQKLENTEILVIDDCSKDNSVAVVEALIE